MFFCFSLADMEHDVVVVSVCNIRMLWHVSCRRFLEMRISRKSIPCICVCLHIKKSGLASLHLLNNCFSYVFL